MRKFVLYSRQSKKSGNDSQMTLETSEFTMKHYLDTLSEPYEIIKVVQEVKSGFKASSRNREEFNRATELCKKHNASLLVSNMSRLSRNTAHGAQILEEIDVIVASAPSANKAMKQIMLVMAEDESEQQSNRRKAVYQAKKKRCEESGEELVWGGNSDKWKKSFTDNRKNHKSHKNNVEARKVQLPVIEKVKQMIKYSKNTLKLSEIADNLTQEGFTTPRGCDWSEAGVSRLIKSNSIEYKRKHKHL